MYSYDKNEIKLIIGNDDDNDENNKNESFSKIKLASAYNLETILRIGGKNY